MVKFGLAAADLVDLTLGPTRSRTLAHLPEYTLLVVYALYSIFPEFLLQSLFYDTTVSDMLCRGWTLLWNDSSALLYDNALMESPKKAGHVFAGWSDCKSTVRIASMAKCTAFKLCCVLFTTCRRVMPIIYHKRLAMPAKDQLMPDYNLASRFCLFSTSLISSRISSLNCSYPSK